MESENLREKVLQLVKKGIYFLKYGDKMSGLRTLESVLSLTYDDKSILSTVYSHLGNAYCDLHDYDKSFFYHMKDFDVSQELDDKVAEAKAKNNLGKTLQMMARHDEAIDWYTDVLDFFQHSYNNDNLSEVLFNIGVVYHEKAKHLGAINALCNAPLPRNLVDLLETALTYYKRSLKNSRELNNKYLQCVVLGNMGNVHFLLTNFRKAVKLQSEKITICKDLQMRPGQMKAHIDRGNVFVSTNAFESAIDDFQSALSLASEINDFATVKKMNYVLSNTLYIANKNEMAEKYITEFLDIAEKEGDLFGEARSYLCLTNIMGKVGKYDSAHLYATKHLEMAKKLQDDDECALATRNITNINVMMDFIKNKEVYNGSPSKGEQSEEKVISACFGPYIPSLLKKEHSEHVKEDVCTTNDFYSLIKQYHTEEVRTNTKSITFEGMIPIENKTGTIPRKKDDLFTALQNVETQRLNDQRSSLSRVYSKFIKTTNQTIECASKNVNLNTPAFKDKRKTLASLFFTPNPK